MYFFKLTIADKFKIEGIEIDRFISESRFFGSSNDLQLLERLHVELIVLQQLRANIDKFMNFCLRFGFFFLPENIHEFGCQKCRCVCFLLLFLSLVDRFLFLLENSEFQHHLQDLYRLQSHDIKDFILRVPIHTVQKIILFQ